MLDRSIRDIERERQQLQAQEKKLIADIKKTAKAGQMVSVAVSVFHPHGCWMCDCARRVLDNSRVLCGLRAMDYHVGAQGGLLPQP